MKISNEFVELLKEVYAGELDSTHLDDRDQSEFIVELKQVCDSEAAEKPHPNVLPPVDHKRLSDILLSIRKKTIRQFKAELPKTRRAFPDAPIFCPVSLFGTMEFGRLEVAHTRTLAWLMNPDGDHGFNSVILADLFSEVSGKQNAVFKGIRVTSEKLLAPGRTARKKKAAKRSSRADIWVEGHYKEAVNAAWKSFLIFIEAKVEAPEGEDQLGKYDRAIRRHAGKFDDIWRIFLTPDGREPATAMDYWEPLSFKKLVKLLTRSFIRLSAASPGYHFLRFYIVGILSDILGWSLPVTEDTTAVYQSLDYLKLLGRSVT